MSPVRTKWQEYLSMKIVSFTENPCHTINAYYGILAHGGKNFVMYLKTSNTVCINSTHVLLFCFLLYVCTLLSGKMYSFPYR